MKPLVAGNWKMHKNRADAKVLADALLRSLPSPLEAADVALFPPFTALAEVVGVVAGSDITVGAQNCHPEDKGAFTGEISPPMLLDAGATRVLAYITHPVLSGPAVGRIADSQLDELVVTDTIPLSPEAQACDRIRQLGVAELLAETMRRISLDESVSSLYLD